MDLLENRYWPFNVSPSWERTEYAQRQIDFLETAYAAGYKPYVSGSEDFGATAGGRGGSLLYRGCKGRHWEILLGTAETTAVAAHVDDFACAAAALLQWLRGTDSPDVFESLQGHFFVGPGCHFVVDHGRREGTIVARNARGTHWEVAVRGADQSGLVAHVDDLDCAAVALLKWARGLDGIGVLEHMRDHLRAAPDCPEGYILREAERNEERKPA